MADELYVQLSVEGVDEEGLASLTNHLRNELLQLDVDDARERSEDHRRPALAEVHAVAGWARSW